MELEQSEFTRVETIFGNVLLQLPHRKMWTTYLDYIRRRNSVVTEAGRQVVSQAFDSVLANIGQDPESGPVWKDYIQFVRSGPGTVGGSSWQDQQKMDTLRKAYRQAVVVPHQETESIWRDYYAFENSLNPVTVCTLAIFSCYPLTNLSRVANFCKKSRLR